MLPNISTARVHRWGTGHKRCPARALCAPGALTFPQYPCHRHFQPLARKGCSWCITPSGMGVKGNKRKRGWGLYILMDISENPREPAF